MRLNGRGGGQDTLPPIEHHRSSTAHTLRPSSAVPVPHDTAPNQYPGVRGREPRPVRQRDDRRLPLLVRVVHGHPPAAIRDCASSSVSAAAASSASWYRHSCNRPSTKPEALRGNPGAASSDQFADRRFRPCILARAVPARLSPGAAGTRGDWAVAGSSADSGVCSAVATAAGAHAQVTGYVRRPLAQRPGGDVSDIPWRYSLMNWGHDPEK